MSRFMRKGKTKVWFVPSMANPEAGTVAEVVTAGTELNVDLGEVNGFTFANSPIQTPDMDTTFTAQIGGEDTAAESSMGFYEQDDDTTIRDALAKDTVGYVLMYPTGIAGASPAALDEYEAWPVIVTSNARTYTVGNEAAMFNVSFSITDPPVEGVVAA